MADVAETSQEDLRPEHKKQKLDDSSETKEQTKPLKSKRTAEEENQRALLYDSDDYSDDEERQRDIQKYREQIKASGGYEVDAFPKLSLMGYIVPASDVPEEDMLLEELAILAVNEYNKDHSSSYKLDKVVNGTARGASGTLYYITFLAKEESSALKCFRAKVFDSFSSGDIKVISCDLEANDSSKQLEMPLEVMLVQLVRG